MARIVQILYSLLCMSFCGSTITIRDNGYEGISIAINEVVPENEELLERIEEIFTDASAFLYQATKKRAFFKEILIYIPITWENLASTLTAESGTVEKSDFVIDNLDPEYGTRPFTIQPRRCEEVADVTVLSPEYILDTDNENPFEKVIVHEWGHLRYGLFDEYPTNDEQRYYDSTSQIKEATRCSFELSGQYLLLNGEPCAFGTTESECEYQDNKDQTGSYASLMYRTNLKHVDQFCDNNANDVSTYHNIDAENDQNTFCGGRSAWEVIRMSEDFANGNNEAREITDTTPTFRYFLPRTRQTVVVMDTSVSMEGDKILKMANAVELYLRNFAVDGEEIGLVRFSSTAKMLQQMTIVSDKTRQTLVSNVPRIADGITSIGSGIKQGLSMLDNGGILIVLSDGQENQAPYIKEVHGDVIEKEVTVHSIALTNYADSNLDALAGATGGLRFIYSFEEESNALTEAFHAINDRNIDVVDKNLQLESDVITVEVSTPFQGEVYIDSTVGRGTRFIFDVEDTSVDITLTSPDGSISPLADADHNVLSNIFTFYFETAQVGTWTYIITNSGSSSTRVALTVVSKAADPEKPPIVAHPFWSHRDGLRRVEVRNASALILNVRVSQGYSPVLNTEVGARITTPNGNTKYVLLKDHGHPPDTRANDSIYVQYVLPDDGIGRYGVKVIVKATNITTVHPRRIIGRGAPPTESPVHGGVSVGMFKRVVSAGLFEATYADVVTGKKFSPDTITSLKVVSVDQQQQHILMNWVATGAELNLGTASYYEVRYSMNYTALRDDFGDQSIVTDDDIVQGNLSRPREAGTNEELVLSFPSKTENHVYYAIKAYDTDGRNVSSEVSNVAYAFLTTSQIPTPAPTPGDGLNPVLKLGLMIGIPLTVLAIVLVATIVIVARRGVLKGLTRRRKPASV